MEVKIWVQQGNATSLPTWRDMPAAGGVSGSCELIIYCAEILDPGDKNQKLQNERRNASYH